MSAARREGPGPDAAAAERRRVEGVLAAGAAYLLWGGFPFYFRALAAVPLAEIVAHRITWSAVLMVALVTAARRWPEVRRQLAPRGTLPALAASALLISSNWLVYIWAVGAGRVVDASLGYYVNPLLSVLLGVAFLGERLSRRQGLAVALAAAGVLVLVVALGHPPWVALWLAGTFGLYGLVRKRVPVDAVTGLLAEVLVLVPLAGGWLAWRAATTGLAFGTETAVTALLLTTGVVTAVPLLLFGVGVRRLRLATIGLLQYLNPTAQLLVAVFAFGEPFGTAHFVAFSLIWVSLGLYSWDGLSREPSRPRPPGPSAGAPGGDP